VDRSLLQSEPTRVLNLLRSTIPFANIREVGSTAVEGLLGKQDVDFALSVKAERFDDARLVLDRTFARNDNQLSNAEFQAYVVPSIESALKEQRILAPGLPNGLA
jgi:GrpB-like predicted nucleotidyltransferase (UPF0157 family)